MTTAQKKEWIENNVTYGIPDDEDSINFYYRALHDYDMGICDADDWAWLNTMFRYDIGASHAREISNWFYLEMDTTAMEMVSVDYKDTLKNICEFELGIHLDFSHWPDKEPEAIECGFKEYFVA